MISAHRKPVATILRVLLQARITEDGLISVAVHETRHSQLRFKKSQGKIRAI